MPSMLHKVANIVIMTGSMSEAGHKAVTVVITASSAEVIEQSSREW